MKTNQTILNNEEKKILNDILNFKYKDYYLIYNRKSTNEPDNQKNSLSYQKSVNMRYVEQEHLSLAINLTLPGFCRSGNVSERHSGFKVDNEIVFGDEGVIQLRVDRPKFYRLVQFLSKRYFKGVIFLCWDRASRNDTDSDILKRLKEQEIDVRFALANYDNSSSGVLHMTLDGMFANHSSRVSGEKIRGVLKEQRNKGICTYRANVGYLNLGNAKHKPFDTERSPIILRFFELASTGEWSCKKIATWAIEQGFTMPPIRRRRTEEERLQEEEDDIVNAIEPISRFPNQGTIHSILTNRFYIGEIKDATGTYIKSTSHEPLVSHELFYRVQEVLKKKNVSARHSKVLNFPLRSKVRCKECTRAYTPYMKKGNLYFASKCIATCENSTKNINFKFIEDHLMDAIKSFVFTEEEHHELWVRSEPELAEAARERQKRIDEFQRKKRKIWDELSYMNTNKITLLSTGVFDPKGYIKKEEELRRKFHSFKDPSGIHLYETREEAKNLSELIKTLTVTHILAKKEKFDEINELTETMFSELSIFENTLEPKAKIGLHCFQNRFIRTGGGIQFLSDLATFLPDLKARLSELQSFIKQSK